jgi:putative ABC transport system permease protein
VSAVTTLAWRYLFRRRLRAALTTTAIVFGVALVVAMGGMVPTLTASLTAGVLSGVEHVDLSISSTSRRPFPSDTLERVRGVEGVAAASGRLQVFVPLAGSGAPVVNGRALPALQLNGVEVGEAQPVRPLTVLDGQPLSGPREMLVTDTLKQAGVGVGSTLRLPSASGQVAFTVVGVVAARPGGVEPVYVSLADAREVGGLGDVLSELSVRARDGVKSDELRDRVMSGLGADYRPEGAQSHGQLMEQVSRMAMPMQAFGVLAMVMAGFIIFITFRTVVAERRRDLGLLRALGASRAMVVRLVVV